MLKVEYSPKFKRDYKRLLRKHFKMELLDDVIRLISVNDEHSKTELVSRHNMHSLKGKWNGNYECHVANIGDWLLVWCVTPDKAFLARTGTHDEIFKD